MDVIDRRGDADFPHKRQSSITITASISPYGIKGKVIPRLSGKATKIIPATDISQIIPHQVKRLSYQYARRLLYALRPLG